jgi:hypothetical protein
VRKSKVTLCISDLHAPYGHADSVAFLKALSQKYSPDLIVCMGDEADHHGLNFHGVDPDLLGHGDEIKTAIGRLKPIYDLFPKCEVLESNHGSLGYRRAKFSGMSKHMMKPYPQQIESPKGWKWHMDLVVSHDNCPPIYFCHGKSSNILGLSQSMGMCVVQSHFHEKFSINYWANPIGLYWAMQLSCLIEDKSLAFAYNKINKNRPIVGTGVIINGHPKLEPMVLKKDGRWTGKLV